MPPENTITLVNALSLFGGLQGIVFAFILLGLATNNSHANRYLALILGILGVILIHQFLLESGYIRYAAYLLGASSPLEILISPALYLYVRTLTVADDKKISRRWIITPIIIIWVLLLPFLLADFDVRLSLINNQTNGENSNQLQSISFAAVMLLSGLMFTACIALSFKLLFAHKRNIAFFFSYRENVDLAWLRNLLLVMVAFWGMMVCYFILLPLFGMNTEEGIKAQARVMFLILDIFTVAATFYLGVMGLLQPRVYKSGNLQVLSEENEGNEENDSPHAPQATSTKYKKSALDQNQSQRILKRLLDVMEHEKPYLKSDLTLPDLATLSSTTPNYLSQVINEKLNMSFFDYVNAHRIETAKNVLINPLPNTQTILDVAMYSAFNSKSAFYSAFKKQMNMTPTEFRKRYA